MTQPESRSVRTGLRRRRTRRHRRNRLIRRILFTAVVMLFVFGLSAVALQYFSPSLFRASNGTVPDRQHVEAARTRVALANQAEEDFHRQAGRPIYPYSVVPGGVEDARELKWVAEHDPVVAAHYAGFDYDHARVVRLTLARTVYVSYRIGNHVYWTRRRVTLHKGEKVITDGNKTVRARCGNRVEEAPQVESSSSEPPAWKFDDPLPNFQGTAMQEPPVPFQSALNRGPVLGPEPGAPLSLYNPFTGGSLVPISPPPLPAVCAPKKKGDKEPDGDSDDTGKKKKKGPCGGGGPPETVPEPGTWLLVATGLGGMYWHARRKLARA